ncbi:MAG: bifunctional helix-turn-helix transcriptional regulator/GNAT family N-acetyltransferase [Gemmatimonadaceae bacterium]
MPQRHAQADAVREFNRFYTRRIGALGDAHLGSAFSLTEVRVLYELAHREQPTAAQIADNLSLDRGYLSRTLRVFKRRGLIATKTSAADRRATLLSLTAAGRKAFAPLDRQATDVISGLLSPLSDAHQRRVLDAMHQIRSALDPEAATAAAGPAFTLRTHHTGDMGWVVERHGTLYDREYGWGLRFESLVARVVADFIDHFDPARERCWIAERNGERVGSIFVVAKSKTIAKLRLLLVDSSARGLGIGERLVDEVIRFSREVGYRKILLWTQSDLASARRIYAAKGFRMIAEEGHELFGSKLTAETWELKL